MSDERHARRARLGFDDAAERVAAARCDVRPAQPMGLSPSAPTPIDEHFSSTLTWADERSAAPVRAPARVFAHDRLAHVFLVEATAVLAGTANVAARDDGALVDLRSAPEADVFLDAPDGRYLLAFRRDRCELHRGRTQDARARRIDHAEPEPLEVPGPATLVRGASWPAWLSPHLVELLSTGSALDAVAALGLTLRAAATVGGAEEADGEHAAFDDGAVEPVRAWSRGLGDHARARLEQLAVAAAALLGSAMAEVLRNRGEPRTDDALRFCLRREELEAARTVLRVGGGCTTLDEALARLDERAAVHASVMPIAEEHARVFVLRAASALDPDSWWAADVLDAVDA